MNRVLFSRKSDHWSTPEDFLKSLGKIDFDPCPLFAGGDVNIKSWYGRVFVNPPYSDIYFWIQCCLAALRVEDCKITEIIMLLPSRTGTKWWHELVMPYASEIQFLRGRLKFGGAKNCALFDSVVVYFSN